MTGGTIYMNEETKKLSRVYPERYGMDCQETILAAAVKFYLQSQPEIIAQRLLSEVIDPRVLGLSQTGAPTLLRSDVEGTKLAALINAAQKAARDAVSQNYGAFDDEYDTDGISAVKRVTSEFMEFLTDCYRALKY
jgi:hypothetical protein